MCTNNLQTLPNNGSSTISTANPNRDGSGAMGTLLTAGGSGTLIKSIFIQATGTTSLGMIRLFIQKGSSTFLIREVEVPAMVPSATDVAFSYSIYVPLTLETGAVLKASTENAETFNVVADAYDWTNCACS